MESSTQLKSPDFKKDARPGGKPERARANIFDADGSEGSPPSHKYRLPPADASSEIGPRAAWLAAIRNDPAMTPAAFRLAVILSSHMKHQGGEAKPSLRLLGRCIRRTRRYVYTHLGLLRAAGYLKRLGDVEWPGKPHVYVMQFPEQVQP